MAQIFHPSTNTIARVSILGAVFILGGVLWLLAALNRSSYATEEGVARQQPVQFSHEHHVGGLGIDCRYCHTSVEVSAFAGMPSTATCMNCHAYIWTESPFLAPVRDSFRTGQSIAWTRVYDLPDFLAAIKNSELLESHGFGLASITYTSPLDVSRMSMRP